MSANYDSALGVFCTFVLVVLQVYVCGCGEDVVQPARPSHQITLQSEHVNAT